MSDLIASLVAMVSADISGLTNGLNSGSKQLKDFAGQMTTSLTLPIVAFLGTSLKAASDSQTQLAQLDAVLKSTVSQNGQFTQTTAASSKELKKWQGELAKATEHLQTLENQQVKAGSSGVDHANKVQAAYAKVIDLQNKIDAGNNITKTQINVTHMARQAYIDLAAELQNVTRYSDEETLSAENLLLTFTNIKNDVFPQATRLVQDMSTALGQDLKSSAIQLGKALQDPVNGITALKRVGVNFTDAQKDMIKSMVAAGNVAGAQKVILKELATEFGGSAVAAGKTFAGQMDILKNKFNDFQEKVGTALMPMLQDGMGIISGFVDGLMKIPAPLLDFGIKAALVAAAVGPLIGLIGNLTSAVGLLMGAFFPIILPLTIVGGLFYAYQNNILGFRDRMNELGVTLRKIPGLIEQVAISFLTKFGPALAVVGDNFIKPLVLKIDELLQKITGIKTKLDPRFKGLSDDVFNTAMNEFGAGESPDLTNIAGFGGYGAKQFASGGPTGGGGLAMLHESEYVVPKGGALVGGGSGPSTIHLVLQAHDFEQHLYYNVGKGIARGNAMAAGG